MADSVGTYSNLANIARVRAGLTGNPGRLQNGNPTPKLTFVDGVPPLAQKAIMQTRADQKMDVRIIRPY